jgi:ornithine carbamoyltransferase
MFNNRNRSLLSLVHHTDRDLLYLLDLSRDLKRAKYSGLGRQSLAGKNIALIFEKTSTRTRCAFGVAAYDEGAHVTYIDPASSQIGHKESMKDTARVLGRMYDAIEYRGAGQEIVEELAEYAGVPVFNGLTDEFHPTQMLADVLTMTEHCPKPLTDIAFAFVLAEGGICDGGAGELAFGLSVGTPPPTATDLGGDGDPTEFAVGFEGNAEGITSERRATGVAPPLHAQTV